MQVLGLNKAVGQLDMVNSVHWCPNVFSRKYCHVLKWAVEFEAEDQ